MLQGFDNYDCRKAKILADHWSLFLNVRRFFKMEESTIWINFVPKYEQGKIEETDFIGMVSTNLITKFQFISICRFHGVKLGSKSC